MAFIIVAGICACLYFLFLCFMVFQVFRNISGKRMSLPAMSKARRLHYEVFRLVLEFLCILLYIYILTISSYFCCLGFNFQVQVPDAGHLVLRSHDRHLLHHQSGEDRRAEESPQLCTCCARLTATFVPRGCGRR